MLTLGDKMFIIDVSTVDSILQLHPKKEEAETIRGKPQDGKVHAGGGHTLWRWPTAREAL